MGPHTFAEQNRRCRRITIDTHRTSKQNTYIIELAPRTQIAGTPVRSTTHRMQLIGKHTSASYRYKHKQSMERTKHTNPHWF